MKDAINPKHSFYHIFLLCCIYLFLQDILIVRDAHKIYPYQYNAYPGSYSEVTAHTGRFPAQ